MAATARTGHPPRTLYTLLEGRGLVEMALLPAWLPLLQTTPRGDGHTVLLVPGFTAGDATLVGLQIFLRSRGYHVETWGFGQNTGFKLKFSQALEQKVRFLHHRTGRKVSLVGWSLGGVYAYYATHCAPAPHYSHADRHETESDRDPPRHGHQHGRRQLRRP